MPTSRRRDAGRGATVGEGTGGSSRSRHTGPLLARAGGAALRAIFAAVLLFRRPRPIHAHGIVLRGHITWLGNPIRCGIDWIDIPPITPTKVEARLSRSVGLPPALPDIWGLALRFDAQGNTADIELASTGVGAPGRFVLLPHRSPAHAHFGSLLPYRGTEGARLIGARTIGLAPLAPAGLDHVLTHQEWHLQLLFATPTGKWHPFATLTLRATGEDDDLSRRFDTVTHPLPGARTYDWVRALRQPSYRLARSHRASPE